MFTDPSKGYSEYANVLPIFAERLLTGQPPIIYGDGGQTRDFVAVQDVVQANLLAAANGLKREVFNIATGKQTTINQLAEIMQNIIGTSFPPQYELPRQGEVRDSVANIEKSRQLLGYEPKLELDEGIDTFLSWYKQNRPPST